MKQLRVAWRVAVVLVAAMLALTFADAIALVQLFFVRTGSAMAMALFVALAVIGAGSLIRRRRPDIALDFVIGYPIFGTACFLVGLLKVNTLTMVAVTIAFAATGAFKIRNSNSEIRNPIPTIAWIIILAGVVLAQAPPHSFDELAYHLAIPHTWAVEGRAIDLPLISHSYFPLGIQSADLPLLTILGSITGGIASHFLHLLAAIATSIIIHRRTKDWLLTAAIICTPALALTAGWSLIDWPLLGICVAMLDDDERDVSITAGLLTSYTFVPIAIIVFAISFWRRRAAASREMKSAALHALMGCVFFARNLILTGNPLAPFFTKLAPRVTNFRPLTLGSYIFDSRLISESLGASLLASLTMMSSPVAIALAIAGFFVWTTAPSARILVPFFGTAATGAKLNFTVIRIVIGAAVVMQLFLLAWFVEGSHDFDLLAGRKSDREYLNAAPNYEQVAWMNASTPPQSRTLLIGMLETYWFEHPVRGGGNFDGPRVSSYVDTPTPEALRARLAHDGITHVAVINAKEQTQLSPSAQRGVAQMLDRYTANVASHGDVTLLFTLK